MQPHDSTASVIDSDSIVFVVDDHGGIRKSLRYLMESAGLEVEVFECAEDFLSAYQPARPGCLVTDVFMPGMTGVQLLEQLAGKGDFRPAILISGQGDIPTAVRAMKVGAVDFLEKPFEDDELLERVQQCVRMDAEWRTWRAEAIDILDRMNSLSPREREVMDRVVDGHATKEIARLLDLSPKTVEIHRGRVMRKMRVQSSLELVKMVLLCRKVKSGPLQP